METEGEGINVSRFFVICEGYKSVNIAGVY